METLLDDCPNAKVLLTCREAMHQPSNEQNEMTLSVDGMTDRQDCWRIFEEQYNLIIPTDQKKELANTLPDQKLFPEKFRIGKKICRPRYTVNKLGEHHLFELLQWNPQAIKTTATMWKGRPNQTLVELYQQLVDQNSQMVGLSSAPQITLNVQLKEL